eukprot:m.298961 g.298961  ORF g.298961 m.298961 type:complete len:519 (-) comp16412_c2_seq15:4641-6197(-)
MVTYGQVPLDKLVNEYVLEWPGVIMQNETVSFTNFMDDFTNPTHTLRQIARVLQKQLLAGNFPKAGLNELATISSMFDPDWYGLYYGQVSPENNNFYTDFVRVPMLTCVAVVGGNVTHPLNEQFKTVTQQALAADTFHSVTLPGGASQEAPGYLGHAMSSWLGDAPLYAKYMGFDPSKDPRILAAVDFQFQLSHPFNYHALGSAAADPSKYENRYITPIGDTHPNSVNYTNLPLITAYKPKAVSSLKSLEIPGFGVVLHSQPGTLSETFLSFKAGPNRGHNHGDQLSIHWCAYGTRHAIDLLFGYNPRPLEEFWHNRYSFSMNSTTLQNMDGFERLIQTNFGFTVDAAMGTVSSSRLRTPPQTPPGIYAAHYPEDELGGELNYTRAVVLVKQSPQRDYIVMKDDVAAPLPLVASFNQWYMQDGPPVAKVVSSSDSLLFTVDLGNSTLFVASMDGTKMTGFTTTRWTNTSEGNEFATGIRVQRPNVTTVNLSSEIMIRINIREFLVTNFTIMINIQEYS